MSGALAFMIGAGGASATVTLGASYNVDDLTTGSAASASFSLESDGDIITALSSGSTDQGDWLNPKSAAPGAYEARATLDSGDTPSGTLGSWVALSSTRTWGLSQVGIGAKSCVLTIEVGLGGVALDTTSVSMSVEQTP